MAKTGRPKKEIDWEELKKLSSLPIRQEDVAWVMDLSVDTLSRAIKRKLKMTFAEYMDKNRSKFRINLLAKQYEIAMKGNPTMLIWLGKNYLEQSEPKDVNHEDISQGGTYETEWS